MKGNCRWAVVITMALYLGWSLPVQAETYVGGELGLSLPQPFSSIQQGGAGIPANTTTSDQAARASLLYGGKLGHYLQSVPWLGVETELFNTNPNMKQQNTTFTIGGLGSSTLVNSGTNTRILTWANDIMVRYPGKVFQPYAGVGLGVFFTKMEGIGESVSPGLDVKGGLRVLLTDHVAAFGEYKYNYMTATVGGASNNLAVTYQAQALACGLSYHFNK